MKRRENFQQLIVRNSWIAIGSLLVAGQVGITLLAPGLKNHLVVGRTRCHRVRVLLGRIRFRVPVDCANRQP